MRREMSIASTIQFLKGTLLFFFHLKAKFWGQVSV
jgi:hypothetical protein